MFIMFAHRNFTKEASASRATSHIGWKQFEGLFVEGIICVIRIVSVLKKTNLSEHGNSDMRRWRIYIYYVDLSHLFLFNLMRIRTKEGKKSPEKCYQLKNFARIPQRNPILGDLSAQFFACIFEASHSNHVYRICFYWFAQLPNVRKRRFEKFLFSTF